MIDRKFLWPNSYSAHKIT